MNEQINQQPLQDQHLDMMIRLAFLKDEEEETKRFLDEPDPILSEEDEMIADRAFLRSLNSGEEQRKKEKWDLRIQMVRRIIPKVVQAAACLILVLGVAVPVALATSATFRSSVMQLLIQFDNDEGVVNFSFIEDKEAAFYVPEGYTGEYYPSYIPDGFVVEYVGTIMPDVRMVRDEQVIDFFEGDENAEGTNGIEDAAVETITINGRDAYLIEGEGLSSIVVNIIYAVDDKWFDITTRNLDKSEAIRIVESIRKIIP